MNTFNNKTELVALLAGKRIYLWTGLFFVNVTKKALLHIFPYATSIRGTYEIDHSIIRLSIEAIQTVKP